MQVVMEIGTFIWIVATAMMVGAIGMVIFMVAMTRH